VSDATLSQKNHASKNLSLDKLRAIRALWLAAHNQASEVDQVAPEFFFAIGDLFEGQSPDSLALTKINKADFLKEYRGD